MEVTPPAEPAVPEVRNQKTVSVPIAKLVEHPDNPRRGDLAAVRASIRANGWYGFLVVQSGTNRVLAGNHRLKAARELGMARLPVVYLDVDDAEARRILAADNRTSDLAGYDEAALAQLLRELAADAVASGEDDALAGAALATGYSAEQLHLALGPAPGELDPDAPPADVSDAEKAAVLVATWGTALGQVWELASADGERTHRVVCGDSTDPLTLARLFHGVPETARPRLMVTDPPYGVEYEPDWRREAALAGHIGNNRGFSEAHHRASRTGQVENDDRADWREAWALAKLYGVGVAYVWFGSLHAGEVAETLTANGFALRSLIVWRKQHFQISRGHYHWQHETAWYAVAKGHTAKWLGGRKQSTVWDINTRIGYYEGQSQGEDGGGQIHGTQKPVECMARPIRNHEGDVFDPFLGSGTTIVASEQVKRACFGVELSPLYLAVTLERLQRFGLTPRLLLAADAELPA